MKYIKVILLVSLIISCKSLQPTAEEIAERKQKELERKTEKYMSNYIAMAGNGYFSSKTEFIKLSKGNFKIDFAGNALQSQSKGENMSLLLAAELCYEEGFEYFIVPDSNSRTVTVQGKSPDKKEKKNVLVKDAYGNLRNLRYTETTKGEKYDINKPRVTTFVKCIKSSETNENTMVYQSELLIKSMSEKYRKLEHMNVRYPNINKD